MRGNHETYASPANNYGIPQVQASFPQTRTIATGGTEGGFTKTGGATFTVGSNFNSPTAVSSDLNGMTYSFDYGTAGNNARFVILDDWATPNKRVDAVGYAYGYSIADQQSWISGQLDKTARGTEQAFVFSHQNLIGENHQDSLFNGYTNANPSMQNDFMASLQNNDVKYYMSGHDHVHQRSIITSSDGLSKVQQIIGASDSSKFYTPKAATDPNWFGQKTREQSVSQDLYTVGFYTYTVDGPQVTARYFADDHGNWKSDASYPNGSSLPDTGWTPTFNFVLKSTWGYSLNGKEKLVAEGTAYDLSDDTTKAVANGETGYLGTTASIKGANGSTIRDYNLRQLIKTVDTGWKPHESGQTISDIFSLWGTNDIGQTSPDPLLVNISVSAGLDSGLSGDSVYMISRDHGGTWGLEGTSFQGDKDPSTLGGLTIGQYGYDSVHDTVWAVVGHDGDFAAVPEPSTLVLLGLGLAAAVTFRRRHAR
jgi:hypothetical protein